MKNKKVTSLLALLLSSAMALSVIGCGQQEKTDDKSQEVSKTEQSEPKESETEEAKEEDAWFTVMDDSMPVVNEGVEKSISIGTAVASEVGPAEESWAYAYITENMNINLDVTQYPTANVGELISLAFASGEVPDLIFNAGLSAADIQRYGMTEGQLLNLAPYIEAGDMPNLAAALEAHPEYKTAYTLPDGGIYGLGLITNTTGAGALQRGFYNYAWLNELGLDVPETLDEFLDAMRAMKAAGYCEYPIGGAASCEAPAWYILNAFGYINPWNGTSLCLRNGEVVYPAADREVFGEYLKLMNQIYEEGLIHADYYTVDNPSMWSVLSEDAGFIGQAPHVFTQNWADYFAAMPLTSEWNDTPQWYYNDYNMPKGQMLMVSADCENLDFVLKFIDWLYVDNGPNCVSNGTYLFVGYIDFTPEQLPEEELLGVECVVGDNGYWMPQEFLDNQEAYGSLWGYAQSKNYMCENTGLNGVSYLPIEDKIASWGFTDFSAEGKAAMELWEECAETMTGDPGYLWFVGEQYIQLPYTTTEMFPSFVFMDAEQMDSLNDTKVALNEYASTEIARFITGDREVSDEELEDYFDTLDAMGAKEYVQAYAEYWADVKGE